MARVRIGTIGWEFESWDNGYYPEDIPQEWKLGYYANDLTAVVVPESVWKQADAEDLEEMSEDIHEDFGFYFQVASSLPSAGERELVKEVFADTCLGFLVEESVKVDAASAQDRDFIYPSSAGISDSCNWSVLELAGAADCVIRVTQELNLRELREHFERLQQSMDFSRDILVLVDTQEPAPESIKQLRTMLELMMIA